MSETLICVADDIGVRVWLERVLDDEWSLECVSSSDLSRVSRLAQATQAEVVLVAVEEGDPGKSLKLFSAIQKANPEASLVAVAKHISQTDLLNIMRAGARDCLITAVDADAAKGRIRNLSETARRATTSHDQAGSKKRSITMVVGGSSVVDTRFFCQNLASEINKRAMGGSVLAIDSFASESRTFYLDSLNRLTLNDLMRRTDTVDQSFVNTALEEYSPGLRLLSGQISTEALIGDASADLFIAISQLSELFDHIVIRVGYGESEAWLKVLGSVVSQLIVVAHPVIDQTQYVEGLMKNSGQLLHRHCATHFVLDGVEKRASLSKKDIEKRIGVECQLELPIEWQNRLDSINAGVPLSGMPKRSAYLKKLIAFVKEHYGEPNKLQNKLNPLKGR